ncbi:MAG: hypothetical protein R6X02_15430 [Enhygromyxa sp.]
MIESSSRTRSRVFVWAARLLGRVESRLVLSAAIIVSLLPFEWVTSFDGLFLIMFSIEFALRATLVFRGEDMFTYGNAIGRTPSRAEVEGAREWQWPSLGTLLMLVFDLLALLSFVPSLVGIEGAETRWLRLFRLSRMLLLLSYWAPLVRDVWSVMVKGERARQVALMGVIVLALSFAGTVVLDQVGVPQEDAIDFDGDDLYGYDEAGNPLDPDDEKFFVHLWWAFRQVQDPGNMMASPHHAVAVLVSVSLTVVGLFMVSFLIGLGTDVVRELMELARLRPPGLRGHTIIVNIEASTRQLLGELLRYSHKLLPDGTISWGWFRQLVRNTQRGIRGASYLVVGRGHDPPEFLRQPDLARITYRQADVEDQTFLLRADVVSAQRVVLLADFDASDPDAATIQALLTITQSLREVDEGNRWRDGFSTTRRARLLIAEILDESNIPAARAAIDGDGSGPAVARTRAYVVPSERLIALFMACIVRRPGAGRLLEVLLTSFGQEIYTLFFDLPGLGYRREHRPELPDDPSEVMGELMRRARTLASRERVVPVGVLMAGEEPDEIRVFINPEPDFSKLGAELETEPEPASAPVDPPHASKSHCLGFVALADNFGRIRELADDLYERPRDRVPPGPDPIPSLPSFVHAPTTRLERVLVCGFRSGTVSMVEALIQAEPRTQILIMLGDEKARAAAWDDFDAHSKLVRRGLLDGHHGVFSGERERWALTWDNPDDPHAPADHPHVHLVIGDWSSSRQLISLPLGFGHVATMDAVILISSERRGSDARIAKTLMKLETLTVPVPVPPAPNAPTPRIVAEVLDVEFARRLRRRATKQGSSRVSVYSIQELRAVFMFQSVVVPSFDLVYAELMGPWGESFVRLVPEPDAPRTGTCSFEALADHLCGSDRVLVAVEICERSSAHEHGPECRTTLHVAAGSTPDGPIELEGLVGVWVITRD